MGRGQFGIRTANHTLQTTPFKAYGAGMTPMTPPGPQKSKSSTVLLVVLAVGGLSAICCIGTLAAIAVPNFIKFGARAKQAEVRSNLKALFTAERAHFMEHDAYTESFEELNFIPERGNRYRYVLSTSGELLVPGAPDGGQHSSVGADQRNSPAPDNAALFRGIPASLLSELGLKGDCPASCRITAVAVANLDADATVDVWSVSTEARTIDGQLVAAGVPHKHVDDIEE